MTVILNLPPDLEQKLQERAHANGQDVAGFVRQLLERELETLPAVDQALAPFRPVAPPAPAASSAAAAPAPDPVWGALHDAADELDEIVAEALSHREQQPWRLSSRE